MLGAREFGLQRGLDLRIARVDVGVHMLLHIVRDVGAAEPIAHRPMAVVARGVASGAAQVFLGAGGHRVLAEHPQLRRATRERHADLVARHAP